MPLVVGAAGAVLFIRVLSSWHPSIGGLPLSDVKHSQVKQSSQSSKRNGRSLQAVFDLSNLTAAPTILPWAVMRAVFLQLKHEKGNESQLLGSRFLSRLDSMELIIPGQQLERNAIEQFVKKATNPATDFLSITHKIDFCPDQSQNCIPLETWNYKEEKNIYREQNEIGSEVDDTKLELYMKDDMEYECERQNELLGEDQRFDLSISLKELDTIKCSDKNVIFLSVPCYFGMDMISSDDDEASDDSDNYSYIPICRWNSNTRFCGGHVSVSSSRGR